MQIFVVVLDLWKRCILKTRSAGGNMQITFTPSGYIELYLIVEEYESWELEAWQELF